MMHRAVAEKLTKVLETVFKDFQDSIDSAARYCENSDASTALYNVSSAIDSMDIGYQVREALEISHDAANDGFDALKLPKR